MSAPNWITPWITPTEADVLTRLCDAENSVFKGAVLAPDQSEPLQAQIVTVIGHMRLHFISCPQNNPIPEGNVIPKETLMIFLGLMVPAVETRLIGLTLDEGKTQMRTKMYQDAVRALEQMAACELSISPDNPVHAAGECANVIPPPSYTSGRAARAKRYYRDC